jgi:hypothetical protein
MPSKVAKIESKVLAITSSVKGRQAHLVSLNLLSSLVRWPGWSSFLLSYKNSMSFAGGHQDIQRLN